MTGTKLSELFDAVAAGLDRLDDGDAIAMAEGFREWAEAAQRRGSQRVDWSLDFTIDGPIDLDPRFER